MSEPKYNSRTQEIVTLLLEPVPDPSHPDNPSDPHGNPHPGPDPNPAPDLSPSHPDDAPVCGAPGKRGLEKRGLCALDKADTERIKDQIKELDKNKGNTNKLLDSGDGRWPTSLVEKLGDNKMNMALDPGEELTGCTVIFAHNQEGDVYMSHIWEVPSFTTDENYPEVRTDTEFIEFLENGQATSQNPAVWKGPALNSDPFIKSQTHVSWITPGDKVDDKADYGDALDKAEEHIKKWLGEDTTFDRNVYQRPDESEKGVKPYFEYDPRVSTRGPRKDLNSRLMWGGPYGRVAWTKQIPAKASGS